MKAILLFISVSISVLFSGCSKDDLSSGAKLFRVYGGGQLQSEYLYNSNGLLSTHTGYFAGRKSSEVIYYYDASNKLIKRESAFDFSSSTTNPQWSYSYTEYIYSADGKASEEKNYLKQNNVYVLVSKRKPGYDANGKLISSTILSPADVPIKLTKYEYNNKGNIVLQEEYQYNGTALDLHFKYLYDDHDDKINPYLGLNSGAPPYSINRNNILQTTVINYIMTPGTPLTTVNKTIYNSYDRNGLPLKFSENGAEFTYEYK